MTAENRKGKCRSVLMTVAALTPHCDWQIITLHLFSRSTGQKLAPAALGHAVKTFKRAPSSPRHPESGPALVLATLSTPHRWSICQAVHSAAWERPPWPTLSRTYHSPWEVHFQPQCRTIQRLAFLTGHSLSARRSIRPLQGRASLAVHHYFVAFHSSSPI